MFKMCSPNLEVNGMTYDKALEEKSTYLNATILFTYLTSNSNQIFCIIDVEPFDENQLSDLISLESNIDVMTLRVTENRRNSPEIIKKKFEEILLLQSFMKNHAEIIDDDTGICDMQIDSDVDDDATLSG